MDKINKFISSLPEAVSMQVYRLFTTVGIREADTKYAPEWAERRYRQRLNQRVSTLRGMMQHAGKRVRVYSESWNGRRTAFIGRIGQMRQPTEVAWLRFTDVSHCFRKIGTQPWERQADCVDSRTLGTMSLRRELVGPDTTSTVIELLPTL
jgi:hypothetical protein